MNRFLIIAILYILSADYCAAQQPAHSIIGQDKLAGADIYDIVQDQNGIYWITTNHGVFKYDGREFSTISMEGSKAVSFFSFIENSKGEIFCTNLSGQVYKLTGEESQLFYQLPDSLLSPFIRLSIDDHDNIFCSGKETVVLDSTGSARILELRSDQSLAYHFSNGDVMLFEHGKDFSSIVSEGATRTLPFPYSWSLDRHELHHRDEQLHFVDFGSKKVHSLQGDQFIQKLDFSMVDDKVRTVFFRNQDQFYLLLDNNGIILVENWKSEDFTTTLLFENDYISAIFEDGEGNLLLGTFGSGIIFIPAKGIESFQLPLITEKIRKITGGPSQSILIGTVSGKLYQLGKDGEVQRITLPSEAEIIDLDWMPSLRELWVSQVGILTYDNQLKYKSSIPVWMSKDLSYTAGELVVFALTRGVAVKELGDPIFSSLSTYKEIDGVGMLTDFIGRAHRVAYDSVNQIIYAATSNGIQSLKSDGTYREVRLKGQFLLGRSFYVEGDMLYVGTQKNGIVQVRNSEVVGQWDNYEGAEDIIPFEKYFLISTNHGIEIIDRNGELIRSIGVSDGLNNSRVTDMSLQADVLWIADYRGLHRTSLDLTEKKQYEPDIKIASVLVNNDLLKDPARTSFSPNQRKFQYELHSSSMRNREELFFEYKMEGLDDEWHRVSYFDNLVEFLSLPPGEYVFLARSVFRGQKSDAIKHRFTIAKPFYDRWWFYLFIGIILVGVTVSFLRRQSLRHQKEARYQSELNLYKLRAIRSQMNPHFLFNALNSIQEYIMMNERKKAGKYLGTFADLMRLYLNHSNQGAISLSEELEALHLYLQLEKVRFEDVLSYEVESPSPEISDHIMIPAMLIQPYVENALKHGLLHKRQDRRLYISFEVPGEKSTLVCTIVDNGVGRRKSMEINQSSRPGHRSFATKASGSRLEILNYGKKRGIGEQIIDLYDERGEAAGTRVILKIPINERQF